MKTAAEAKNTELQTPRLENDAKFEKEYGGANRKTNATLDTIEKGASSAGSLLNLLNPFKWGKGGLKGAPRNNSSAKGRSTVIDSKTGEILDEY